MKFKMLTTMLLPIAFVACDEQGPMERFGEELDNAAYEVEDAANDVADDLDSAATDAANAVEDACEDATDRNC